MAHRWLWLAAASLPIALLAGPANAVAWEAGADDPQAPPAWAVGVAFAAWWLEGSDMDLGLAYRVFGVVHAASLALVALTVHAVGQRLGSARPRRSFAVASWSLRVGGLAMLSAYATNGYGWLLDLGSLLAAAVATVAVGCVLLRQGDRVLGSTLAAGTVLALGFSLYWMLGYVPGFVALALALVWATAGVVMARRRDGGAAQRNA